MMNHPQSQRMQPRGFVLLIAVLILAGVTVVASGIFSAASGILDSAQASKNEALARSAANYCLEQGRIYLEHYKNQGSNPVDFDGVLDPGLDSQPGSDVYSDDYVPIAAFGGTDIYIPSIESSATPPLRKAMHRYRYLTFGATAGCALRFDDNNDDVKNAFGFATNNNPVNVILEGTGVDIPYRDRDLALVMTAIGMAPVGASAATAYDTSQAHVTFRNLTNSGGSPGMVAGGKVTLGSNIAFCGVGGFAASQIVGGSGSTVCSCGDIAVPAAYSAQAPSACIYPVAGNTTTGKQCQTDALIKPDPDALPCVSGGFVDSVPPTVNIPLPRPADLGNKLHWLEASGWQDPDNPQSMGQNGLCEFWFRHRKDPDDSTSNVATTMERTKTRGRFNAFVWDHTDTAALGCSVPYTYNSANIEGFGGGLVGNFTTACGAGNVVKHDCTRDLNTTTGNTAPAAWAEGIKLTTTNSSATRAQTLIKRPCRWYPVDDVRTTLTDAQARSTSAGTHGMVVVCTEDETPCWKLQNFNNQDIANSEAENIKAGGWSNNASFKEHSNNQNGESFAPRNDLPIPNIANPPTGGTGNTWDDFCGLNNTINGNAPQPCTRCSPTGGTANVGGVWQGWHDVSDEHIHFEDKSCADQWPSPSIVFFEKTAADVNSNNGRFHVVSDWGEATLCNSSAKAPVRTTVLAKGHADVEKNTQICGVFSQCGTLSGTLDQSWPPTPCNLDNQRGRSKGVVLRAMGDCSFDLGSVLVGDVTCGTIEMNQGTNKCLVSNLTAFNKAMGAPMMTKQGSNICAGVSGKNGMPTCGNGICIADAQLLVGDMTSAGDICIDNGARVSGSILSVGTTVIQNDSLINGQAVAGKEIGFANDVTISNFGTGKFGQKIGAARRSEPMY
jgi:hypothetical protein